MTTTPRHRGQGTHPLPGVPLSSGEMLWISFSALRLSLVSHALGAAERADCRRFGGRKTRDEARSRRGAVTA